jgi:hypothetical protein
VPLAAKALRPLKPLFVVHVSAKQESVLGKACKILTLSVRREVRTGRSDHRQRRPLNVRVCADTPNNLTKGSSALLIDIEPKTGRYRVETYESRDSGLGTRDSGLVKR